MSIMLPSSWKLILFIAISYLCLVHGGEDKSDKSATKLSEFKAKLAKAHSVVSAEVSTEENLDHSPISILGITVPPEFQNDTIEYDHHTYYNSTFYVDPDTAKQFWINIDSYPQTRVHEMLSNSHRQATTIDLKFDFPFYGSPLKNVTIATGGFLYMGDYLHNWIAATQYVAPLMANFDTSQSKDSLIKYADNGTAFTVEWNKVFVKNKMNEGAFTFQVTLFQNGDIVFAYKEIPHPISNISDFSHPVKIGVSDAYVLERSLLFMRRKTIYEYHRIDMLKKNIRNNTALYLTALPTCLSYKDCNSCLSADPKMECKWCQAVQRCSDGMDRQRQNWINHGCTLHAEKNCPASVSTSTDKSTITIKGSLLTSPNSLVETSTFKSGHSFAHDRYNINVPSESSQSNPSQEAAQFVQEHGNLDSNSISVGAIITIVAFIVALLGATGWIVYAYKFPQTTSGQFLIKYRPSQWTVRKDDNSVISNSRHL